MKILNQNISDSTDLAIETTKVSALPEADTLPGDSFIHIVYGGNTSRKMKIDTFNDKVYEAVQNNFKVDYNDLHAHEDEDEDIWSFKKLSEYINGDSRFVIDDFNPTDTKSTFVEHVNYDFDILRRYMVKRAEGLDSSFNNLQNEMRELDCRFSSNMSLHTTDENNNDTTDSVWHKKTENDTYCQMQIQVGNNISNEWTTNASGMLVVVGWLDSTKSLNNKAIPSSFCCIEGKIDGDWEVLGVQTVIPAKTMSYVGFTIPVNSGLTIRARTGFFVEAKSGQFSQEQDGFNTLSNSTPNGFKCMIYSNQTSKSESEGEQ